MRVRPCPAERTCTRRDRPPRWATACQKQMFLERSKPGNRGYWTEGFRAWTFLRVFGQAAVVAGALIAGNTARSASWSKPHPQLTASHARLARNCATSLCSDKMEHKDRHRTVSDE